MKLVDIIADNLLVYIISSIGEMFVQTKKGMDLSPDYTQTSFNECHRKRYFNENQC